MIDGVLNGFEIPDDPVMSHAFAYLLSRSSIKVSGCIWSWACHYYDYKCGSKRTKTE